MSQLINPVVNLEFYQISNRGKRASMVLAKSVLEAKSIQDIPHLCGWLCLGYVLHEGDSNTTRAEIKTLQRYLGPHIANCISWGT